MAWQKNKICLMSVEVNPTTGKKVVSRYLVRKSKGKNKANTNTKLSMMKFHRGLQKHTLHTETKINWK